MSTERTAAKRIAPGNRRGAALLVLVAVTALLLSGCGRNPVLPPDQLPPPTPGVACGGKDQLAAEGSSAQANAFAQFSSAFQAQCPDNDIDYNPSGSGSGVKQFTAGQVDIGGTDSPLEPKEVGPAAARCQGHPAWHLPLVFGPIAVTYNVGGLHDLVLTPQVMSRVFSGGIKTWNDPAIAELNPGKPLPDAPINVVYRNDDSGTTDNFQQYLGSAAPQDWTLGDGKTFHGGVGEGKAKSQGVAEAVGSTPNSISYVEASYATNAGLGVARIDNGAGPVELNTETASRTIESARTDPGPPDRPRSPNDMVMDTDSIYGTKDPGAYPLLMATYELVCSDGYEPETGQAVKAFMKVAAGGGQEKLAEDGYVPLPPQFRERVARAVDALA